MNQPRTPQANLIALLEDGACRLFVCPLCLDTSTNTVECTGREGELAHDAAEVVRVGPWNGKEER
jgi:hypothetical protein